MEECEGGEEFLVEEEGGKIETVVTRHKVVNRY